MNDQVAIALLLGAPLAGAALLAGTGRFRVDRWVRGTITLAALALTVVGLGGGLGGWGVIERAVSVPVNLGPLDPGSPVAGVGWSIAPAALALLFLAIAVRSRSGLLVGLAAAQLAVAGLAAGLELSGPAREAVASPVGALLVDPLAAALLGVSVAIGGPIVVYALGYEPAHLAHRGLPVERSATFLGWLLVFVSAMHLLVLADDLRLLAVGWEATTLCSFVLIGFDGDAEATRAARRALAYNLAGGVGLGVALLLAGPGARLSELIAGGDGAAGVAMPLILAGCIVAAATKSALVPFHPWLLGAMVAAAPVSALLHASAMVKAGSYLLLRLAPALAADGFLGTAVTLLGAFTFATAALLALRQRDLKRILALSTISTLGLIAASAGLGSAAALSAGVLLLVFHAAAKALAFLAVGAIEQVRQTRDIEALVGSLRFAPLLAGPLVIAAATLALPPFGLVVAKWAILEIGARDVALAVLLALGGAANLALWTVVVARLLVRRARPTAPLVAVERLPATERLPIAALAAVAIAALVLAAPLARWLADPAGATAFGTDPKLAAGWSITLSGGVFAVPAVAILLVTAAAVGVLVGSRVRRVAPSPYLSGAGLAPGPSTAFHGTRGQPVVARSGGFYWGRSEAADESPAGAQAGARADGLDRAMAIGGWLAAALVILAAVVGALGALGWGPVR